jgi:hypothetical protein
VARHHPVRGGQDPLAAHLERGLVLRQRVDPGVRSVCHQAWVQATALWTSRSETERLEMIRSVYARVDVEGPKFMTAYLTPDARDLGLTLALPEEFVMASPAGFEPATRCLEGSRSVH